MGVKSGDRRPGGSGRNRPAAARNRPALPFSPLPMGGDPSAGGIRGRAAIYLRTSTTRQTTENQRPDVELLARARRLRIVAVYDEQISATARTRPGFARMLDAARRGEFDTLIVWALDRFGRSMFSNVRDLLELDRIGVQVLSVRDPWLDTSGPTRSLLIAIFSWVAEQEKIRISERTRAGLARARARGTKLGRPRRTMTPRELERARELFKVHPLRVVAQHMRIPRATLHRCLKKGFSSKARNARAKQPASRASRKRSI